ncbi:hypothetical protein MSAN_01073300 [Mycena sanguinolenta]|uniref:Uncharacterized protein n=1 Tax=Mycena sanguinolenta TaxID=230812 RepID=A0A8H6YSQ6_9AGAR|nr:hypothetical protein MSAN_01073300 [Mycena sanguinolenta]
MRTIQALIQRSSSQGFGRRAATSMSSRRCFGLTREQPGKYEKLPVTISRTYASAVRHELIISTRPTGDSVPSLCPLPPIMSTQDRAYVLAVCKAPSNLSYEAFQSKFTSIVDTLLALPISQQKFLKFDIIYQTEFGDEQLRALGLTKTPPGAVVTAECATVADFLEMIQVPEFANVVQDGRKSLYGNNPPVDAFVADVKTHLDRPASASNRTLWVGAVPYLGNAPDVFRQSIGNFGDKLATLPVAEKFVKYSLWNSFPNNAIATPSKRSRFPHFDNRRRIHDRD